MRLIDNGELMVRLQIELSILNCPLPITSNDLANAQENIRLALPAFACEHMSDGG